MVDAAGIDTLLELSGHVLTQAGGYWVKIDAWRVEPSPMIPHGIRYALTLHDTRGTRVMGFDNAHAPGVSQQGRYTGRIVTYDHQHRHATDKGIPYAFQDAYELMKDFFAAVDRVIQERQS
jgi:hypothetical protein